MLPVVMVALVPFRFVKLAVAPPMVSTMLPPVSVVPPVMVRVFVPEIAPEDVMPFAETAPV